MSLGNNCLIKINYDIYCKKNNFDCGPTNFFDYLISSMESVFGLFNNKISVILSDDNIIDIGNFYKKKHIKFKLLNNAVSMHDLPFYPSPLYYRKFKDKYIRRFNRFFEYIQNLDKIYFIRNGDISYDEFLEFDKLIKEKNNNINYFLISINKKNIKLIQNNFIKLNYFDYEINNNYDKYYTNINWTKLFNYIKNL